jgi:pimeloyl-ACP methyl ester carboxylesterase
MVAPLLNYFEVNGTARLLRTPLVGELLMRLYVLPMLLRRRTQRYRGIDDGRFVAMFRDQLRLPGFGRSLLSLIRSGALGDQSPCYERLGEYPHPVLLLCGAEDSIASPTQMQALRAVLPRAEYEVLEDATHALCLTHPAAVACRVTRFLSRPDDRLNRPA